MHQATFRGQRPYPCGLVRFSFGSRAEPLVYRGPYRLAGLISLSQVLSRAQQHGPYAPTLLSYLFRVAKEA